MTYKTFIVHVEPSPDSKLRLRIAVDLSRYLDETLIGAGGCEPAFLANPMMRTGYSNALLSEALADRGTANLTEAESGFRAATSSLGSAAPWLTDRDYPDRALGVCAAGADLIVASAHRGPKGSTDLPAVRTKTIIVAWKKTRKARRAVSDALPLLEGAEEVSVLRVCPSTVPLPARSGPDDVADRVQRHGMKVRAETPERPSAEAFQALTKFAEEQPADLHRRRRLRPFAVRGMDVRGRQARSAGTIDAPRLFSH